MNNRNDTNNLVTQNWDNSRSSIITTKSSGYNNLMTFWTVELGKLEQCQMVLAKINAKELHSGDTKKLEFMIYLHCYKCIPQTAKADLDPTWLYILWDNRRERQPRRVWPTPTNMFGIVRIYDLIDEKQNDEKSANLTGTHGTDLWAGACSCRSPMDWATRTGR